MATGDLDLSDEDIGFDEAFGKGLEARGETADQVDLTDDDDDAAAGGSANNEGNGGGSDAAGQPQPGNADDPWKDAPPQLRQMYVQIQADALAHEHSARSNAGRVAAYQRKIDELQEQLRSSKPGAPDKGGPEAQDDDGGGRNAFAQDFPEAAGFTRETVDEAVKPLKEKLEEIRRREEEEAVKAARQSAIRIVASKHPDFDQIRNSTEYAVWIRSQAPGVQALTQSGDPHDAITLCDMFKARRKPANGGTRARVVDAAVETPSKGAPRRSGLSDDDFDANFNAHADRIDKRNRQHQR